MKRVIQILLLLMIFAFLGCAVYSFMQKDIPELISSSIRVYRLDRTLLLFYTYIPCVLFTGFLVGFAVVFGRSPEGSANRFSPAMFTRYKTVVLSALGVVVVLTAVTQILRPVTISNLNRLEYQPFLFREYMNIANDAMQKDNPALAYLYADRAALIDPNSIEAAALKHDAEIAREDKETESEPVVTEKPEVADTEGWSVYRLLQESKKAAEEGKWFNSHYYAELAVQASTPDDINLPEAKMAAAEAWNKLSDMDKIGDAQMQDFFARKKAGYVALMNKETLKAYYIFNTLSTTNGTIAADPDVRRYLALAKQQLGKQYFFIDETYNLQKFENIHSMHFSVCGPDNMKYIVLIRGVTDIKSEGNLIRYLRGLTVYSFDAAGSLTGSMTVPYAKMMAEPVSFFQKTDQKQFGLTPDLKNVPYILLKSVDRKKEGIVIGPEYRTAEDEITEDHADVLVLPMPYDDFGLIADSSNGPAQMEFFSLMQFFPKAVEYGYAGEVYGEEFTERILYPFVLLILLVFTACFAWNYRIGKEQVFKFKWIFTLPFFSLFIYFILNCIEYMFKILNFTLGGLIGRQYATALALFVYALLFFCVSFLFLSRKD